MAEYDSAIALARRLIKKKGRTVTVKNPTQTVPDADKPWDVNQGQPVRFDAPAVAVPIESKYVDGSTVLITDKQLFIAAGDAEFTITPEHKLIDKGYEHQIIKVEVLEPGGQSVLYTVLIR